MNPYPPYLTTQKNVGETPLEALTRLRREKSIPDSVPMAYAGRLDPMASGMLLILIGDTCKVQEHFHGLDKEYQFEVLLGISSDTGDVLGLVETCQVPEKTQSLASILNELSGIITLPYPHFSSKTVQGKPLHMWTLEGRLREIEIPTKTSTIYQIRHTHTRTLTGNELFTEVTKNIESIPQVTDPRKALGEDFRRDKVRDAWKRVKDLHGETSFTLYGIKTIVSSGTYMRSLAEEIGRRMGSGGIALGIHRTKIGIYSPLPLIGGFWRKVF